MESSYFFEEDGKSTVDSWYLDGCFWASVKIFCIKKKSTLEEDTKSVVATKGTYEYFTYRRATFYLLEEQGDLAVILRCIFPLITFENTGF